MMNKGIDTVTTALETVKQTMESYDTTTKEREVIFGG